MTLRPGQPSDQGGKLRDQSSVVNTGQTRILSAYIAKGGVGKTTFCQTVATVLAALGRKVALIDTDKQANASSNLIDLTPIPPSRRFSIANVVLDDVPLIEALYQAKPNLWVCSADDRVNDASIYIDQLAAGYKAGNQPGEYLHPPPNIMADRLRVLQATISPPPLRQSPNQLPLLLQIADLKPFGRVPPEHLLTKPDYLDFIIIDHAPNPMALGNACLAISTEIWAPVIPEPQPFEGLLQMLATVKNLFEGAHGSPLVRGILPSQVYHRYQVHNSTLAALYAYFGPLITRSVHRAAEIPNAQGEQPPQTVFEYARSSKASKEWVEIALRIDGYGGALANNPECAYCEQIRTGIAAKVAEASKTVR